MLDLAPLKFYLTRSGGGRFALALAIIFRRFAALCHTPQDVLVQYRDISPPLGTALEEW